MTNWQVVQGAIPPLRPGFAGIDSLTPAAHSAAKAVVGNGKDGMAAGNVSARG